MLSISLSALLYLSVLTAASPLSRQKREYTVKSFHHPPRKWERIRNAPAGHVLNLQIGLKQSNMQGLLQDLDEVSDPKHARYGQHLTADQIDEHVKPSNATVELVESWLQEHGVQPSSFKYSSAADWLSIEVPVHQANTLLNTTYSIFEHASDGVQLVRTTEWSLPAYLHEHIDVIEPTNSFLRPMQKSPKSTVKFQSYSAGHHPDIAQVLASELATNDSTPCNASAVTPGCLRSYYGTIDYVPQATDKNKLAIANYLGQVNIRSDLLAYLQAYRPDAVSAADEFEIISIDGGTTAQVLNSTMIDEDIGVEGNLDIQTVIGIAYPTNVTSYSTGGSQPGFKPDNYTPTNSNEPYLAWVTYMLGLPDEGIPYVVSTSYGDDEQTVSPDYAVRVCNSFAQLGARGVSLFFSSGDDGVGPAGDCVSNIPPYTEKFLPTFPAACPYITVVGATQGFNPEVAAYDARFTVPLTSGAGFSEVFARPSYQAAAVDAYLSANDNFPEYEGLFNASGRAYPDVSAAGVNFTVFWDGGLIYVDGSSASAPAVAAIIALVNDALLAAGKSTLGFLNPWLYGRGYTAFTDITSGSSAGCDTDGFPATEGWDAVTGFGTPRFGAILKNLGLTAAAGKLDDGWKGLEGSKGYGGSSSGKGNDDGRKRRCSTRS